MISVAEAMAEVRGRVGLLEAEDVPIGDALGRVLAADLAARLTHPPADVSAMDGYAVRAADCTEVPVELAVIGESAAGRSYGGTVGAGECTRIFTGAALPDGADAIVIQEDTERDGDRVTVKEAAGPGAWIRAAGMDFKAGQVLLPAGRLLSVRDVALAAAMNHAQVPVRRRPRVFILSTGDELVEPGQPVPPGAIISSNGLALEAAVRVLGGEPVNLGIAKDTAADLAEKLSQIDGADLLVTSGGASVGDYDLMRQTLDDDDFDLGFYKVAMRPGKPLIFGHYRGVAVLGLPGNPVSTVVTAALFLRAAMEVMLGLEPAPPLPGRARLGTDLVANGRRQDYIRAVLTTDTDGQPLATPFPVQDSSMLARLAEADCLIVRAPGAGALAAGSEVEILPLKYGLSSL